MVTERVMILKGKGESGNKEINRGYQSNIQNTTSSHAQMHTRPSARNVFTRTLRHAWLV